MKILKKNPEDWVEKNRDKNVKTVSVLILTVFLVLILSGVASAGTPLQTNQTGTVSGDLYVNTTNGWPSSTQGATNEVTQANTLPAYTSIDSAWVYVNVYSGSGTNNWPVRTTIKLDGNGDGDYDDPGELLGVEDMNIPGTTDGTVYWLNDHCNRVYSDYQVWYDVKNLITSNNPKLYVKTENMGGDGYDGRIKLLALCVAYNDGDNDRVHYWVLNGQDWINTGSATSTFNTSSFNGEVSSATLNTVALSGTDGTYNLNGNNLTGNLTETGSYYKENQWNVSNYITPGADTNLTYTNVGSSLKMNLATLTIREGAAVAPLANFTVNTTTILRNSAVQFTSTSTGTIQSYAWDFDNNGSTDSTSRNPTYTYTIPGTYTVKLTVNGPAGTDEETKTNFITVTKKIWEVYPTDPQGTVKSILGSAVSGDVVYFHAGNYNFSKPSPLYDPSTWNSPVSLKGDITYTGEGKDVTFLNVDQPVYLQNSNICLEEFTISLTQALYVDALGAVIRNCIIICPTTSNRIFVDSGCSAVFENDNFINGTGICDLQINNGGSVVVSNCIFRNNTNACGAIYFKGGGSVIKNNVFNSNSNALYFYNIAGVNTFYLNTFTNNTKTINYIGTAVTQNFNSPTPILYTYNGITYYGYMGNYWSNYAGRDDNHDGIGDTPYTVPNGFGVDNYPLMAPVNQYGFPDVDMAPAVTATPPGGDVTSFTQVILSATDDKDPNPRIYYTIDGSTPNMYMGTPYTNPISIIKTTVLKFIAIDTSSNTSPVQTETYTDAQVPTVTANPASGTYTSRTQVTLSTTDNADPHPNIYYTLNGTDPTTNSTQYTGPFYIPASSTLKFFAMDATGNISPVQSETYTMNDSQAPMVTVNPTSEIFNPPIQVTLSVADDVDPNPIIYYTIDGTDPTDSSTQYTGPITLTATTTLKYIAVDASGNISPAQSETYTMVDTEAPNATATQSGTTITLSATDNSNITPVIYYTTDGTDPTTSSTPYSGPFTIPQYAATVVKFIAVDASGNTLPVQSRTFTTYTGDRYAGGRFNDGHDLVNNAVYVEGNVGVRVLEYGRYGWFSGTGTGTATWTASDLNIPAGATLISARLYQGRTWYGYPDYTIQFNGHDTQQPIAMYWDYIAGQNVFDVTQYFNLYGDNTAVITGGATNYGTILVVVYEAPSEPYRQIWINEGADCMNGSCEPPYVSYTMFDNTNAANTVFAQITTVLLSGGPTETPNGGDGEYISFNNATFYRTNYDGDDPGIYYFNVTSALQNGTNELGVKGHNISAYFNFAVAVLEVTQATTPVADFTNDLTTGISPLTVQFTDTSSNSPTSWLWEYNSGSGWTNFASGTDSAAQNPQYTFTTPGTYDIRLTATNSTGCDEEMKTGYLTVYPPLVVTNPRTGQIYTSIQGAAADAQDGDTITVQESVYTENIIISKQITLNTTGNVTIQAANTNLPVITVDIAGSGSTITGFNITGATNSSGINLESADGCNITDNVIGGNSVGIKLYNSNSNALQGNTIQNNTWAGICMDQATNNIINNTNIVSNNQEGIFLANNSNDNTIGGNNIHDNTGMGVSVLSNSSGNTIQNNNASHNGVMGIFIQNSNNNIISGNTVQNNGWAGICLDNASGNTINNANIVSNNQEGVFLANNSNGNIIGGNNIHGNIGVGISILVNSNQNTIQDNTASSNGVMGLFVQNSSINTVQDNTVQNNGWAGICLDQATSNTINTNTVTGNQEGVFLANNSDSNIIGGNQVNSNIGDGLSVLNSNSNIATGNQFQGNGVSGMFIQNSNGTIASQNTIESNVWGGVILDTATNTTVYQNNVQNNAEQALAVNGSNNKFYQETTGNYYSDWSTTDPRPVDGNENIYDQYPSLTVF